MPTSRTGLRSTWMRARVAPLGTAALLGCFAVLGTATAAEASQVQLYDGELLYSADPGEDNAVLVSKDGDDFVIVDSGHLTGSTAPIVIVTAEPACTVGMTYHPGDTMRCPAAGITTIRIGTNDGPDSATIDSTVGSLTSAFLYGSEGADQLNNSSDTPTTFFGGPGPDSIQGRFGGSDSVDYSLAAGGANVNLRSGTASSDGDGSSDTFSGIANVVGSNFDDTIQGDYWDNVLNGRNGTDTLSYSGASSGVTVDLSDGSPQHPGSDGVDTLSAFENVVGSATGDRLTGDGGENVLNGAGGDDTLNGRSGDDTLIGGSGSDYASFAGGGAVDADLGTGTAVGQGTDELTGVENLIGSSNGDRLAGNASNNMLYGELGNDILNGRGGQDGLYGGTDYNTVDYSSAPNGVTVDLPSGTATGDGSDSLNGIQNVTGSPYDDWITGDGNANRLDGSGGNDVITGGEANDSVYGGLGNDTVDLRDSYSDTANCGPGTDSVTADASDVLAADCEGPPPPPQPAIRIADAGILEGNTGTRVLSFRVSLNRSSTDPVTVHWSTANGTATAPSDYAAASGTVTFAPGQTTQTISVTIKGDRVREPNQTFTVRLDNPQQATIADARARGTIRNDD